MSEKAYEKHVWMVLLVVGVLLMVSSTAPFYESIAGPPDPEPLLGVSWEELQASNPGVALLISFLFRIYGYAWLGFGFFVTAVSLKSYRHGERWAWYTLWILPVVQGLWVATALSVGDAGLRDAITFTVPLILSLIGLLLPYRKFFPRK
ncbi:MAG: hypothetical protein ACE5KH_01395 [Candidatus Geothermarchaeales archaeon]